MPSPFSSNKQETVSHWGESALIEKLKDWLGEATPEAPFGIGDDCAVIEPTTSSRHHLITTDSLIYGKHFDDSIDATAAGRKFINRNISDIAAMGGVPLHAVISLIIPQNLATTWLQSFYLAIKKVALEQGIKIVGGDIAECPLNQFYAQMTLNGSTDRAVCRHTAEAEDSIWVTGELGGSILGKHHNFTPRLKEGKWLATNRQVHAMIDITDGLGKDLAPLIPAQCAAFIDEKALPASQAAIELSQQSGNPLIQHMLNDGEDYELCFTLSSQITSSDFERAWAEQFKTPIRCIGKMSHISSAAKERRILNAKGELISTSSGYEHLKGIDLKKD